MTGSDYKPVRSLGFQSAIVASIVLSVVSFLTTWSGLRAVDPTQAATPDQAITEGLSGWDRAESLAITLGLAFGIQALMLALAWIASRLLMVEHRKRWGLIAAILFGYLAATTISVTFSYVDLFDRMFSAQKADWSAETMRERGDIIVERLIEDLEDETQDARSSFSTQQAGFQAQLNILSDASSDQRQTILGKLDERRGELQAYRNEIGAARAEARSAAVSRDVRTQELEQSVSLFEEQVIQLTRNRNRTQSDYDVLEDESRALNDAKLLEERGAQESGLIGRGPQWRELDRQHDIVKANLEVVESRLNRLNRELENASEALLNSRQQLAIINSAVNDDEVDQALNASSDIRVTYLEEEIASLTAQADALDIPQIDFSSETISEDQINQIETACTQIKSELMTAQASGEATGETAAFDPDNIDCTSGGAFEAARNLSALQASVETVKADCRAGDSEDYAAARGSELLQYIRNECINASALPARVKANYLEDIRRVALTRDPDAAPIAYSFVALQDREPQAMFSFLLALAADLLILLVSLFGNAGHHEPQPVPASRRIERREPALFDKDD